jgi:hypothetical protein
MIVLPFLEKELRGGELAAGDFKCDFKAVGVDLVKIL